MDKLRAAYRVTVLIGLAMMASLVVYLVIVALVEDGTIALGPAPDLPASVVGQIKMLFLGISVLLILLVRPLSRRVAAAGGERRTTGHDRSRPSTGRDPETGPLATASIITYALSEAPAVLGLVLYFLGRNASDFQLFLIISLFSFGIHFPKFSQWEEWIQQQQQKQKK